MLDKTDEKKLLNVLLNMGEAMLYAGAEVNRVEDTLCRMGKAYGALNVNAFVITSSIIITLSFPEENRYTGSRRIGSAASNDFGQLEKLNEVSRQCCTVPVPVTELDETISGIVNAPKSRAMQYLGSILGAGGFTLFFGGTAADAICSAFFGVIVCFLQEKLTGYFPNKVAFNIICSFLVGSAISAAGFLFDFLNPDTIMIGNIMLLVPGIPMTNSVRDILAGDTISGLLRLCESVLWAGALACGFMLSIYMVGRVL